MTQNFLRFLALSVMVTSPVWSASNAQAQAYEKTSGKTTFVSAHTQTGATKVWDVDDGTSSGSRAETVSLPFPFTFYGVEYTQTTVSSRGYLTFTDNGLHYSNKATPADDAPNALIAPMWDELVIQQSYSGKYYADSKVYHHTRGTAPNRVFLISWYRMSVPVSSSYYSHYNAASASVELYEGSNKIRFIYDPFYEYSYYGTFSWTSGIENADGTEGMPGATCSPNCRVNSSQVSTGTYYDFTPTLDLGVSLGSVPSAATAGQMVTVYRSIFNTAEIATPATGYTIYVSTDATITTDDTPVYSGTVGALQPGATDDGSDTFLLDVDTEGTYRFGIRLNTSDANAANNTSAAVTTTTIAVPLAITAPATLPEAVQSVPIPTDSTNPFVFKAVGPGTTRSWSVSSGSLPAGITLNPAVGVLEGIPSQPTTGQGFTISVSNGTATASRAYTLVVRPRLSIATTTLPEAARSTAYSTQLETTGGPDGRTWSLASGSLPPGISLGATTGLLSGTPTTTGTYTPTVRVSAGSSPFEQSAEATFTLVVRPLLTVSLPFGAANPPDAVTGSAYDLKPNLAGGTGQYTATISEGALPSGLSLNATTGAITGTVSSPGSWDFTYRVTSGDQTVEKEWTLAAYAPLVLVDTSLPDAIEGAAYDYSLSATGGTDSKTWSLSGTRPSGISFSSAGVFSGTPSAPSGSNPRSLTVTVTSGSQSAQRTFDLFVVGKLVLPATTPPDAVRTKAYAFTPPVSGGVATKAFSITGGSLPPGLSLNASTGAITGTPTMPGSFSVTLEVVSGTGDAYQETTGDYSFIVYEPLVITTTSLPDGRVGQSYGPTALAFTGGAGAWSWSAVGLPSGLQLGAQTGELTGTPSSSAISNVTVTLSRGSQTAQRSYSLAVYGTLAIATSTLPVAERGTAYSFDLQASGAPSVTWSLQTGTLPAGLSLTSQGRISGTPSAAANTSTVTVKAVAGEQTQTRSLTLRVFNSVAITTANLPAGITGTSYSAQLAATGGEGSGYAWSLTGSAPPGLSLGASTGRLTGTPTVAGTYSLQVRASSATLSGTRTLSVRVDPRLQVTTASLPDGVRGESYSVTLQATGGAGTYSWTGLSVPTGLSLSSTGRLSGTPSTAGVSTVRVRVTSGGQTHEETLSLAIYAPVAITTASIPSNVVGQGYNVALQATGGSTQRVWMVSSGALPPGAWLTASGQLGGTPTQSGQFTFGVRLTSGTQTTTRTFTAEVLGRLVITTTSLPSATLGIAYDATLASTGGEGAARWTLTGGMLPAGLTLNADTGALRGAPTAAGPSSFEVTAASGTQTARRTLYITVYDQLTVISKSVPEGTRGRSYQETLEAAGGNGGFVWSVSEGQLPSGLSLSPTTGVIGGTPGQAGTFNVTVKVTSAGQEATAALALTIREPLTVQSTTLENATVGVAFEHTFTAIGGIESERTWSVTSGRLPPPLTLDAQTGILAGTPVLEGSYPLRIQVQSGEHVAAADVTVYVQPGEQPLLVTTHFLAPALIGMPYSATIEADGGEPPYTWSSGVLPEGFTFSEDGTLQGTAAVERRHSLTFTVTDAKEKRASAQLRLVISAPEKVNVLEASLRPAIVGAAYSATLAAVGGTLPYAWSVADGALPDGLTLAGDGVIAGTPMVEPGLFAFTAKATDADGVEGSAKFVLGVGHSGEVTLLTSSLADASAGDHYREALVAAGGVEPYVFSIAAGLPPGLVLDRRGFIVGTVAEVGSYTFTVRVDDASGLFATRDLSIAVTEEVRVEAPGCGCAGAGSGGALLLLALLAARRRRR